MSLEQRVTTLENQNRETSERLGNIEISVKNNQNSLKKLFLQNVRQENKIEALDNKVEALDNKVEALDNKVEALDDKVEAFKQETRERFDKMDDRFDKIEDTLAIIVNHLQN